MFLNRAGLLDGKACYAILAISIIASSSSPLLAEPGQNSSFQAPNTTSTHKGEGNVSVYELGNPQVAVISSSDPSAQIDPHLKAQWLEECRRRENNLHKHPADSPQNSTVEGAEQHNSGQGTAPETHYLAQNGQDFCATYFDNYFRGSAGLTEPALLNKQQNNKTTDHRTDQLALNIDSAENGTYVIEEITEEILPQRSRSIPRRTAKQNKTGRRFKN